jgi:membrane fusion protein, copper/silver efflux system
MTMSGKSVLILAVALGAAAFVAGRITGGGPAPASAAPAAHYRCPMHPGITSAQAGNCPECGMKLTSVAPTATQATGVRLYEAARRGGARHFRTLGRVAPIEARVHRMSAGTEGWIRQVFSASAGSLVKRDQPLAAFYGREFIASQQSYFYALSSEDRERQAPGNLQQRSIIRAQVEQTRETLEAMGMSGAQLDEVARTRIAAKDILLSSPVDGFILASDAITGQRFEKYHELYRIADLNRVWVIADVSEREAQFIHAGQKARISVPGSKETLTAAVGETLPRFDGAERVLKLRLEADNPGIALRPDMLADVELELDLPSSITVPDDAVVETGRGKLVFVAAAGRFAPRPVETGWRMEGQIQVTQGLREGEKVALGAAFLIDSDTRLRPAHD